MAEIPGHNPCDYLISTYTQPPDWWAIRFTQEAREQNRPFGGYIDQQEIDKYVTTDPAAEAGFSFSIYREAAHLILDTVLSSSIDDAIPTGHHLQARGRIMNGDAHQFRLLGPGDFAKVTDRLKANAAAKLDCLADLLIHDVRAEAVPLALMTGRIGDVLDEEFAEEFESDDIGMLLRKAERLTWNGGVIFLPMGLNPLRGLEVTLKPGTDENPLKKLRTVFPQNSQIITQKRVSAERFALKLLRPNDNEQYD